MDLQSQLVPHSILTDKFGIVHVKFTQKYPSGVPVFKKRIGVHLKDGKITFISGHFERGLEGIETQPGILEIEALGIANALFKERAPYLELKGTELVILPSTLSQDKKLHLAWHVGV